MTLRKVTSVEWWRRKTDVCSRKNWKTTVLRCPYFMDYRLDHRIPNISLTRHRAGRKQVTKQMPNLKIPNTSNQIKKPKMVTPSRASSQPHSISSFHKCGRTTNASFFLSFLSLLLLKKVITAFWLVVELRDKRKAFPFCSPISWRLQIDKNW